MGGQEKSQRHLGRGNPGQPPRLDCFQSMTAVSNAQPYLEEHTAAVEKKPGILIARAAVVSYLTTSPSNGNKDYPPPYTFCRIRMLYRTWKGQRQREVEGGRRK
jgi:hypothetical protein